MVPHETPASHRLRLQAQGQDHGGVQHARLARDRLDIDPAVQPDVIGTMTDMAAVASESVDAIFSSHNIEHLYPHEVPLALKEFLRVLKPDGFFVVTCPDLQSVCALVAQGKLTEAAYQSPAGPIAAIDILYGHAPPWRGAICSWRTAAASPSKCWMARCTHQIAPPPGHPGGP